MATPRATSGSGDEVLGGRYALRGRLGRGGMSVVYLARDLRLDRDVAVKMLAGPYAADAAFVGRFRREAQAAGALSHPNIVSIYDWGSTDGAWYLVMEYVPGPDLGELVAKRGPMPEAEALALVAQIADALEAAHRRGIVHRDVKPANVLIDPEGRPKLTDFGIARSADVTQVTQTTSVLGTVRYLSPEQVRGRAADGRSDLYSLGVVLYQLLTGRAPFDAETPVATALQHVHAQAVPPRQIRRELSPAAEAIVLKALAKDPEQRHQSAAEMHAALARALGAAPRPAPAGLPRGAPSSRRAAPTGRWRLALALAAVVALALVGRLVVSGGGPASAPRATVPDLAGRSVDDVRAALDAAGLALETDEAPTLDTPAGLVVTQDPTAGERAGPGSAVRAVVSAGVATPDLGGRQCAEARADLAARGWSVRAVRWRIANVQDFGKIVYQEPPAGAVVPNKGEIIVHVAGPVRPC